MLRLIVLAALSIRATVNAQAIKPDPIFDCSNSNFQVVYTACSAGDYHHCCAVGTDCCAGGCCDLLSVCVGIGTSAETCCDFSDVTGCGTGPPPQPSVICTGGNGLSSYKCPPDSTCNERDDSCFLSDDDSGSSSSSTPVFSVPPTSTSEPDTVVITVGPSTTATSSRGDGTTVVVTVDDSSTSDQVTLTRTVGDPDTPSTTSHFGGSGSAVTVTVSPSATTKSEATSRLIDGPWLVLTLAVLIFFSL